MQKTRLISSPVTSVQRDAGTFFIIYGFISLLVLADISSDASLTFTEGPTSSTTGSDSTAFPILSVIWLASTVTVVLFILLITLITYRARKQNSQPDHQVNNNNSENQRNTRDCESMEKEKREDFLDSSPSAIRLGALTAAALQPSEPLDGSNL